MYQICIDEENNELFHALKKITSTWEKRGAVTNILSQDEIEATFDLKKDDYPREIVPFIDHPDFVSASEELKQQVLSWGGDYL